MKAFPTIGKLVGFLNLMRNCELIKDIIKTENKDESNNFNSLTKPN